MPERETIIEGMMKTLYKYNLANVGESLDKRNHKHDLKLLVWAWQGCGHTKSESLQINQLDPTTFYMFLPGISSGG